MILYIKTLSRSRSLILICVVKIKTCAIFTTSFFQFIIIIRFYIIFIYSLLILKPISFNSLLLWLYGTVYFCFDRFPMQQQKEETLAIINGDEVINKKQVKYRN